MDLSNFLKFQPRARACFCAILHTQVATQFGCHSLCKLDNVILECYAATELLELLPLPQASKQLEEAFSKRTVGYRSSAEAAHFMQCLLHAELTSRSAHFTQCLLHVVLTSRSAYFTQCSAASHLLSLSVFLQTIKAWKPPWRDRGHTQVRKKPPWRDRGYTQVRKKATSERSWTHSG